MPTFTCYLPEDLLQRLDEHVEKTPGASRSGILRETLAKYLSDEPATVKQVFSEALAEGQARRYDLGKEQLVSRAESFRRATQR